MIRIFLIALAVLVSNNAWSALSNQDRAFISRDNKLTNPGFESSYAGWATSAVTPVVVSAAGNIGSGDRSISWDSASAAQTFSSGYVTITSGDGLSGNLGAVSCRFKCAAGSCTHTLEAYDGTNKLSSTSISTSTSQFVRTTAYFPFPSSGTVRLQVSSVASNEPNLYIDDCYLGLADGLGNLGTISPVGSWIAFTPSWTNIGFTGTSTNTGFYRQVGDSMEVVAFFDPSTGSGSASNLSLAIPASAVIDTSKMTDTSTKGHSGTYFFYNDSGGAAGDNGGSVTYSSTTAVRFLTAASGSFVTSVMSTTNDTFSTHFTVPIVGWGAETALRPDQNTASWSGYHDSTCSWARTNTSYGDPTADTTCAFTERTNINFGTVASALSGSDKLPGITFTPARAGTYLVCANAYGAPNITAVGATLGAQITDGTTVVAESVQSGLVSTYYQVFPNCSLYKATSTSSVTLKIQTKASAGQITVGGNGGSAIEWSITLVTPALPAPLLVGSVLSNYAGLLRFEAARVDLSGGVPSIGAQTNGAWTVADTATGRATLAWNSTYSVAPYCVCSVFEANVATTYCGFSAAPTTTGVEVRTRTTAANTLTDESFFIFCLGTR